MSGTSPAERYGTVSVERDVRVPMPDGVALLADVWRPPGPGPFPTLLSRRPYGKAQAQSLTFAHPTWYARRGYAVVVQDVRGRWSSEGDWEPFVHEAEDGFRTCEWLVGQPWCDGRVGMWGFSYAGATQLLAGIRRSPGLRAIVPVHTGSDYHEGWTYRGGALALAFCLPWAAFLAADTARRRGNAAALTALMHAYEHPDELCEALPLAEVEPLRSSGMAPYFYEWLAHERPDPYWRRISIEPRWGEIEVPALHVAGWYDIFVDGGVANFFGIRGAGRPEQRLHVGPWAHIPWGPRLGVWDFGPDGRNLVDELQLRFFDRHLREEGGDWQGVTTYVLGRGENARFADWPPPEAEERWLFLDSAGRANTGGGDGRLRPEPPGGGQPPDLFVYDPAEPVRSAGGHSCCFAALAPMGPACQAGVEADNAVLCYTTEPAPARFLVAGEVHLELFAQTSAADTDWTAKLCLVDRGGRSVNLREGVVRARSTVAPGVSVAGEVRRSTVRLGHVCIEVGAGQRLRLQVSSSDFPQWDRNLNTGRPVGEGGLLDRVVATQAVWHAAAAPSRLRLPVVGQGWW
jgi:putative CocE/NonD family hydrolase